jgi:hypothetical protein
MGVDLTLMPLLSPDFWVAHDLIRVERRPELWSHIEALPQQEIPKPVGCYVARSEDGETCYGDLEDTPYGDKMKWTTAGDLLTLKDHAAVQDNWMNRAVWAYLAAMPPEWPIVLYWS